MRRWISFGLVVLVACVAAANLTSPGAWASDSHAPYMTVPTRTPKPRNTAVPPEKGKQPTNTPVVASPTRTATAAQPTKTATPQVTNTATALAGTVQPASTSTATPSDRVTVTTTRPVETTPTATSESTSVATALSTPTIGGGANAAPAAEQPGSSAPGSGVPVTWLLAVAVALMIFGGVLFFGRRRAKDSDK